MHYQDCFLRNRHPTWMRQAPSLARNGAEPVACRPIGWFVLSRQHSIADILPDLPDAAPRPLLLWLPFIALSCVGLHLKLPVFLHEALPNPDVADADRVAQINPHDESGYTLDLPPFAAVGLLLGAPAFFNQLALSCLASCDLLA